MTSIDQAPVEPDTTERREHHLTKAALDQIAHGRVSWLVVGVVAASSAAFLPVVGVLVLLGLAGFAVVIRGRAPVVVVAVQVFSLLAISPRYTIGPYAVTVATLVGLGCAVMWLAGVLVPSRSSLVSKPSSMSVAILVMSFGYLMSYAAGMNRVLLPGELAAADKAMVYLVAGVGVTLLLSDGVRTRVGLYRVIGAFLAGSAVLAAASIAQFSLGFDLAQVLRPPGFAVSAPDVIEGAERLGLERVRGTASHPIEAGAIAAIALPLALHVAAHGRTRISRLSTSALSVALVSALMMSVSRSALLGLVVALVVLVPGWPSTRRFRFMISAGALVVAGLMFAPQLLDAAVTITTDWQGENIEGAGIEGRTEDYEVARSLFVERPLLGLGYGTYNSQTYYAFDNQYLNNLVESGLVGLLSLLAVLATAWKLVSRARRLTTDPKMKDLGTALLASLAVVVASTATYDSLSFLSAAGVFYFVLGLIGAAHRILQLQPPVRPALVVAAGTTRDPSHPDPVYPDPLHPATVAAVTPPAESVPPPIRVVSLQLPARMVDTDALPSQVAGGNDAGVGGGDGGRAGRAGGAGGPGDPGDSGPGGAATPEPPGGSGSGDGERVDNVVSGTRWGAVTQIVTQVARLLVSFVLARVLAPEHYGIVIFGLTVLQLLDIFKDLGTSASVIQRKEINDRLLSSLFYVNVVVGVVLAGLFALASPALARVAGDPEAGGLLAFMSISLVISAGGMVQQGLLRRRFMFGRLAVINMSQAIVNGTVAVTAAYMGAQAWSLVFGQISGVAVSVCIAWISTRWRPRLLFDFGEVRSVARFSAGLTGFNFFAFFFLNADKVLVGAYLGPKALGYYGLGQRILMYPVRSVTAMIQQVLFPAFARVQDDDAVMRRGYLRAAAATALVTFPMMAGFTVVADPFVRGLLPPKWAPAIPIMTILAPMGLLHSLHFTVGAIYQAKGRSDLLLKWGMISGISTVTAYIIGLQWGVVGVASAYAVAVVLLTYPAFAMPFRLIDLPVIDLYRAVRPYLYASILMSALVFANRLLLESQGASPRTVLTFCVAIGGVFYVLWLWAARPPAMRELVRVVGRRRATSSE